MATIRLNVPLLAQSKDYSCWNAAAEMIWRYWQRKTSIHGPMATHFEAYDRADKVPLQYHEFGHFMKMVGLSALGKKSVHSQHDLWCYLSRHGPILCCGNWFGPGHAIVLSGVTAQSVVFADPDGAKEKMNSIEWWNSKLFSEYDNTLMYQDPRSYVRSI